MSEHIEVRSDSALRLQRIHESLRAPFDSRFARESNGGGGVR